MTHDRWGEVNLPSKFHVPSSYGLGERCFEDILHRMSYRIIQWINEWKRCFIDVTEPRAEFLTDLIISTTKVSLEVPWDLAATALITDNKMVAVWWGNQTGKTGVMALGIWSAGLILIRVTLHLMQCRLKEQAFVSTSGGSHLNLPVRVVNNQGIW